MPRTFNLDEYVDRHSDDALVIEYQGMELTVPSPALWDDVAIKKARQEDVVGCIKLLVGAKKYAEFRQLGGNATMLMGALEEAFGLGTPKSPSSSTSSESGETT